MIFKKLLSFLFVTIILSCFVLAAPALVDVSDTVEQEVFDDSASLFAENAVILDIGARQSEANVRYAEINGVQKKIIENNNTYRVNLSDKNVLVEIVEKVNDETSQVVKSRYFYIDVATKTSKELDLMNTHMQFSDEKSLRLVGEKGIRFKAHASTASKLEKSQFVVDEYGYLITTRESLGNKDLTLSSRKFVKGIGFSREKNINIVFDSTHDEYDVFTLVLKNIPMEHYNAEIVCKTYTKLRVAGHSFVVYGEQMTATAYEVASKEFSKNYEETAIAQMMFEYADFAGSNKEVFSGDFVSSTISENTCTVSGSFGNDFSDETKYNVYLATYNEYGTMLSVRKSGDLVMKKGINKFDVEFALSSSEKQVSAIVLTGEMMIAGVDDTANWRITEKSFYDSLSDKSFSADNNYFSPDSEVSVVEGIALVSGIHAKYNKKDVNQVSMNYEHVLEMDDADQLVDMSERNSVNLDRMNLNWAEGGIDEENGYLYATSTVKTVNSNGTKGYDAGLVINGLNLDARRYNKITIRMKLEDVEGTYTNLSRETMQIFFKHNADTLLSEKKSVKFSYRSVSNVRDWFEVEIDLSVNENWQEVISGIRIDPLSGCAKFYIDYVKFSRSESTLSDSWYDVYLDYAIENNIIELGQYSMSSLAKGLSRRDFFMMLAHAFPESAFETINDIHAIPDIEKNEKHSEIYLQLYKAGITLGFDEKGNFLPDGTILRSEAAAMSNRFLVPSNRLTGTVNASWSGNKYKNDVEYNSASDADVYATRSHTTTSATVKDGSLVLVGKYDSGLTTSKLAIDADRFTKLKVRFKADFPVEPESNDDRRIEIYFMPDDYVAPITNYFKHLVVTDEYLDPFGWYIVEIDLATHHYWNGKVNYFRFDPMNIAGTYTIDYIRFIESPYADLPTQRDLLNAGYTATDIMPDGFKNGFLVSSGEVTDFDKMYQQGRKVTFPESTGEPLWTLGCWYNGAGTEEFPDIDAWENRDTTTGTYTFADKNGINTVTYNPELDSMTQRLNATKIYNGKPHIADEYSWWPHQLFNINENFVATVDKEVCSADGDRMFVELDIRMLDFKQTTNTEGMNVCSYLAYFYLRNKEFPSHKIWFGMTLFGTNTSSNNLSAPLTVQPSWGADSAAHQFMYGIPQAAVYGSIENSFNPSKGVAAVGEEWKKIRIDITPHIDRAIEWANRDNIFGFPVEKSDMYFEGLNIGYEVHGNYDATFEIKNIRMISYNKDK